jgi:hypothetical protein
LNEAAVAGKIDYRRIERKCNWDIESLPEQV